MPTLEQTEGPAPERRKTTQLQRFSLAIEASVLLAIISLVFSTGKQAQKLEELSMSRGRGEVKIESINEKITVLSGQILQASSAAAVAGIEARTKVLEARMDSGEQSQREMRQELNARFDRLERMVQASR